MTAEYNIDRVCFVSARPCTTTDSVQWRQPTVANGSANGDGATLPKGGKTRLGPEKTAWTHETGRERVRGRARAERIASGEFGRKIRREWTVERGARGGDDDGIQRVSKWYAQKGIDRVLIAWKGMLFTTSRNPAKSFVVRAANAYKENSVRSGLSWNRRVKPSPCRFMYTAVGARFGGVHGEWSTPSYLNNILARTPTNLHQCLMVQSRQDIYFLLKGNIRWLFFA